MLIGISGPHRSGKSSLARAYAAQRKLEFLETSASSVFRDMGYSPSVTYDFGVRLDIQEEILRRFDKLYAGVRGLNLIVTDRTPLDLLAYTLGDVGGATLNSANELRLAKYVNDCFACMNKRFSVLLIVQPGIPVVFEEGKASLSNGYIEHLNSLILGLSVDERMTVLQFYVPRTTLNMEDRVKALDFAVNRTRIKAQVECDGATLH